MVVPVLAATAPANSARVVENYGRLPLSFEANSGQADGQVRFLSRGEGYSVFLTASGAVLSFHGLNSPTPGTPAAQMRTGVVRMALRGANPRVLVAGKDKLPGTSNYFIGNDPSRWHVGIESFARVRYARVYPGIDLLYHGNRRQLEFDFVVAPHANPNAIQLAFTGGNLKLDRAGNLQLTAGDTEVSFHKPDIYQMVGGRRVKVEGSFARPAHSEIGFNLGAYDHRLPLVIDPVLVYSTYLGGSVFESGNRIALDSSGSAYIVGATLSPDFPTTSGAYMRTDPDRLDMNVFVTKMNPAGTALDYSTFLGGLNQDQGEIGWDIAVDGKGRAFVTGGTYATDFPTTAGAYQTVNKAAANQAATIFVTGLNASGTALAYSTYFGGSGISIKNGSSLVTYGDVGDAIAVGANGYIYVGGTAASTDFPVTAGAFQRSSKAATVGRDNAVIFEIDPAGRGESDLVYSTYIGGSAMSETGDRAASIAVDDSGNIYATGLTGSVDFPITNGAFQTTNIGYPKNGTNGYVLKLDPAGKGAKDLLYSTYLGGSYYTAGRGLALDVDGHIYVTGATESTDFPTTAGAVQTSYIGSASEIAFFSKVNPAGNGSRDLLYSTYLGGSSDTEGKDIAVDSAGYANITGTTFDSNFPTTTGAFQATPPAGFLAGAFLTQINPTGKGAADLVYSSFVSGGYDNGNGIAVDDAGAVYLTGATWSKTFPVTLGAYQTTDRATAGSTVFVAKLNPGTVKPLTATATTVTSSKNPATVGVNVTFTATVKAAKGGGTPTGTVTFIWPGCGGICDSDPEALEPNGTATYAATWSTAEPGGVLITAVYSGDASYAASTGTLTETIKLKTQTITFRPPSSVRYGSTALNLAKYATASSGLAVKFSLVSGPATLNGTTLTITGVGDVVLEATQAGNGSYAAARSVKATIAVLPAVLTVLPANDYMTYGAAVPRLTAYSITGFVGSDTISIVTGKPWLTTTATSKSNAGSYPITATLGTLAAPARYSFAFATSAVMTVENAILTAKADSLSMKQGAAVPRLTYTLTGFVNAAVAYSGEPVLSTTATSSSMPGVYVITIGKGTLAAPNYGIVAQNGTLTVTQ
jgi:hypothetical protein